MDASEKALSVSEFTRRVKALLEGEVPPCRIVGEISNLRAQGSGHLYFAIKDAGAQLPVVMFRGDASRLRFAPRDGMEVVVFGQLTVYEPHGRYQLVARSMEESGHGRLYQEFERLKRKLFEEGLFDSDRKRPLPSLPLSIAVITSPTGAALQDFLRILKRRRWQGRVRIFPSKVQGLGAAEELVNALRLANEIGGFDVIVVTRGGGSLEDLWCFNEEVVARAVAASAIPVLSGVGHEIDFTLCDFAADARAETPSGAAELISSLYLEVCDRLALAREGLRDAARLRSEQLAAELAQMRARLRGFSPERALENAFLRLDEIESRLRSAGREISRERQAYLDALRRRFDRLDVGRSLADGRDRFAALRIRIEGTMEKGSRELRRRLDSAAIALRTLSPGATLGRGFAVLRDQAGNPLTSVQGLEPGMSVSATLKDGVAEMSVQSVAPESR